MNWIAAILFITFSLSSYGTICVIPGHCGESIADTKIDEQPVTNESGSNNSNSSSSQESISSQPKSADVNESQPVKQNQTDTALQEDAAVEVESNSADIKNNGNLQISPETTSSIIGDADYETNQEDNLLLFIFFALIGYMTFKTFKGLFNNRYYESIERNAVSFSHGLIREHLDELKRLRLQLTIKSDFNLINDQKWQRKKQEFINSIIYPEILRRYPKLDNTFFNLNYDQIDSKIDADTNDYDRMKMTYHEVKTPIDFELFVANELKIYGWEAKTTKAVGDQGVDVLAKKNGVAVSIQCKFYTNPVGNDAVQQVAAGKEFYKTNYAVVVTNSSYTYSAKQLAQAMNVRLLHHTQLEELNDLTN